MFQNMLAHTALRIKQILNLKKAQALGRSVQNSDRR